ncbi:hypothetical protein ACMXYQ_09290 [Neptuniibacter sp. PT34_22]|uniref:hypothetical protein n=1 Tax=Neptuniibacter sp. PT34_22 TaxID=3398205 RepID=UPI0039F4E763
MFVKKRSTLALISTGLLSVSLPVSADINAAFEQCRALVQPERRLECYDNLDLKALSASKPNFAGRRTAKTEMFKVSEPTQLRFQSDGAIFVLALHDSEDNIVQNLHIGGGGEDTYLIEEAGDYYLRVNGSTTWRIWLEKP